MKINIDEYRKNKPVVIKTYEEKGFEAVQFMCAITGIPNIAAYCYILEEYDDKDAEEGIKRLTKYYMYSNVEGRRERSEKS